MDIIHHVPYRRQDRLDVMYVCMYVHCIMCVVYLMIYGFDIKYCSYCVIIYVFYEVFM